MASLSKYIEPILTACVLFIPVAAVFTLPFMVVQYRRYGSIPVLRIIVVYAFILYMMCAFLLTVLPLPSVESISRMQTKPILWRPFYSYLTAFHRAGFSLNNPNTLLDWQCWKRLLTSESLFEILANIVMQIPLGIFLRYYFCRNARQTLLIGICVSLFYELTQLSGLFFLYPKAYRFCSVDDLIDNTIGTMIGYAITPLICRILPNRAELDRLSLEKERRLTLTRRLTSAVLDWIPFAAILLLLIFCNASEPVIAVTFLAIGYPAWTALVFIVLQNKRNGQTLGKKLLRIAVIDRKSRQTPSMRSLLIRYFWIYGLIPFAAVFSFAALVMAIDSVSSDSFMKRVYGAVSAVLLIGSIGYWVFHTLWMHGELHHSYRSNTTIIIVQKADGHRMDFQKNESDDCKDVSKEV